MLYRLKVWCVTTYGDPDDLICDYHYFKNLKLAKEAFHLLYMHYLYRSKLFNRNETLNMEIQKFDRDESKWELVFK